MSESLVKSIFLPPFPSHLFTEGTPQGRSGSNTADRSRRGQSQGSRVKHKPSQWDLSAVELQQGTCSPTGVANCEHGEQEQAEKPARLLRSATGSTTALGWLCPVAEQPNTATHCKAPRSHPGVALGGVQHPAAAGGMDRGELSETAWAVPHSCSGNTPCALWRMPPLFLRDCWGFLA